MTPASSFSDTPVNPPLQRTPHTPVRAAPHTPIRAAPQVQSAFKTPVRSASQMKGNLKSTSNSPRHNPLSPISASLSRMQHNVATGSVALFYLVIEGDAPGVYELQ
jgi:hypothetical protein